MGPKPHDRQQLAQEWSTPGGQYGTMQQQQPATTQPSTIQDAEEGAAAGRAASSSCCYRFCCCQRPQSARVMAGLLLLALVMSGLAALLLSASNREQLSLVSLVLGVAGLVQTSSLLLLVMGPPYVKSRARREDEAEEEGVEQAVLTRAAGLPLAELAKRLKTDLDKGLSRAEASRRLSDVQHHGHSYSHYSPWLQQQWPHRSPHNACCCSEPDGGGPSWPPLYLLGQALHSQLWAWHTQLLWAMCLVVALQQEQRQSVAPVGAPPASSSSSSSRWAWTKDEASSPLVPVCVCLLLALANIGVGAGRKWRTLWCLWKLQAGRGKARLGPVRVVRGGEVLEVRQAHLVAGDVLLLRPGQEVPAHVRLVQTWGGLELRGLMTSSSSSLATTTATGAAAHYNQQGGGGSRASDGGRRRKGSGKEQDGPSARLLLSPTSTITRTAIAPAGCLVRRGRARAVVLLAPAATPSLQHHSPARSSSAVVPAVAATDHSPSEEQLLELSQAAGGMALGVVAVTLLLGLLPLDEQPPSTTGPTSAGMALLLRGVASALGLVWCLVPHGLSDLPKEVMATGLRAFGGVVLGESQRGVEAVEALAKCDRLVLDKAGTLTEAHPRLREVVAVTALQPPPTTDTGPAEDEEGEGESKQPGGGQQRRRRMTGVGPTCHVARLSADEHRLNQMLKGVHERGLDELVEAWLMTCTFADNNDNTHHNNNHNQQHQQLQQQGGSTSSSATNHKALQQEQQEEAAPAPTPTTTAPAPPPRRPATLSAAVREQPRGPGSGDIGGVSSLLELEHEWDGLGPFDRAVLRSLVGQPEPPPSSRCLSTSSFPNLASAAATPAGARAPPARPSSPATAPLGVLHTDDDEELGLGLHPGHGEEEDLLQLLHSVDPQPALSMRSPLTSSSSPRLLPPVVSSLLLRKLRHSQLLAEVPWDPRVKFQARSYALHDPSCPSSAPQYRTFFRANPESLLARCSVMGNSSSSSSSSQSSCCSTRAPSPTVLLGEGGSTTNSRGGPAKPVPLRAALLTTVEDLNRRGYSVQALAVRHEALLPIAPPPTLPPNRAAGGAGAGSSSSSGRQDQQEGEEGPPRPPAPLKQSSSSQQPQGSSSSVVGGPVVITAATRSLMDGATLIGLLAFDDRIKPGAGRALAGLTNTSAPAALLQRHQQQGGRGPGHGPGGLMRVVLVTGETSEEAAGCLASRTGLLPRSKAGDLLYDLTRRHPQVVSCSGDVSSYEEELQASTGPRVVCKAGPQDRVAVVRALQKGGHVVMVTGNGLGDVPAMTQPGVVSVVVGHKGPAVTDAARQAAALILEDNDPECLWEVLLECRRLVELVGQVSRFDLGVRMGVAWVCLLLAWPLGFPLQPWQLLVLSLARSLAEVGLMLPTSHPQQEGDDHDDDDDDDDDDDEGALQRSAGDGSSLAGPSPSTLASSSVGALGSGQQAALLWQAGLLSLALLLTALPLPLLISRNHICCAPLPALLLVSLLLTLPLLPLFVLRRPSPFHHHHGGASPSPRLLTLLLLPLLPLSVLLLTYRLPLPAALLLALCPVPPLLLLLAVRRSRSLWHWPPRASSSGSSRRGASVSSGTGLLFRPPPLLGSTPLCHPTASHILSQHHHHPPFLVARQHPPPPQQQEATGGVRRFSSSSSSDSPLLPAVITQTGGGGLFFQASS